MGQHDLILNSECALCGKKASLCKGHIIPKFMTKRTKSGQNTLYSIFAPNHPLQDTQKVRMLCIECEQLLSINEKKFQQNILPNDRCLLLPIKYGDYLLKFAVSLSWRALTFFKYSAGNNYKNYEIKQTSPYFKIFPEKLIEDADKALVAWSNFILNKSDNPGVYEQHLLVFGAGSFDHEENICRTIGFTHFEINNYFGTFFQMRQLAFIGFIVPPKRIKQIWTDTKIHLNKGIIGGKSCSLPQDFAEWLRGYLAEVKTYTDKKSN